MEGAGGGMGIPRIAGPQVEEMRELDTFPEQSGCRDVG